MSGSFDSLFDFYCHNLVQEEARVALFGGICAGKYLHLSQSFAECMHPQPFNYSGPDSKLDMVRMGVLCFPNFVRLFSCYQHPFFLFSQSVVFLIVWIFHIDYRGKSTYVIFFPDLRTSIISRLSFGCCG